MMRNEWIRKHADKFNCSASYSENELKSLEEAGLVKVDPDPQPRSFGEKYADENVRLIDTLGKTNDVIVNIGSMERGL